MLVDARLFVTSTEVMLHGHTDEGQAHNSCEAPSFQSFLPGKKGQPKLIGGNIEPKFRVVNLSS